MTYHDAIQYVDSLTNFEFRLHQLNQESFSLDSFRQFLSLIGDPQSKWKSVHIAGSKGKGSTAAITAQMLSQAGYRVGLYTSPHLYDVRERIRIIASERQFNSEDLFDDCISTDDFTAITTRLKETLDAHPDVVLTYFEFLTAMAFEFFAHQRVDIVVLETGLGGRLDATNVVQPLACGITRIDTEHTHILGDTIEQITAEKAGIIKPGCFGVVSGQQDPAARQVIRDVCVKQCVDPIFVGEEIRVEDVAVDDHGMRFGVVSERDRYEFTAPFLGEFQAENVAAAIGIVELLNEKGFIVDKPAMRDALVKMFWPARMEIISQDPLIVIDGAHTAGSSKIVCETIASRFPDRRVILIFGMSAGKDCQAVARNFAGIADQAVLTQSSHCRADAAISDHVRAIFQAKEIECVDTPCLPDALRNVLEHRQENDMICVAGSLFLAAEARAIFLEILEKSNVKSL